MAERKRKKSKFFTNDVRSLLYAFGDVENPLPETVSALEDVLITYLIDTCHEASAFARTTRRQKIKVDDFKFVLRRDAVKHGRVEELLKLQKVINDARKQFDNSEGKSLKNVNYDDDDKDDDLDDGVGDDELNTSTTANNTTSTSIGGEKVSKKGAASGEIDPKKKPKRKYNKDPNKERKPYKKRAKKGETAANSSVSTPKP